MNTMVIINLVVNSCAVILTLMLALSVLLVNNLKKPVHRWFFLILVLNLALLLFDLLIWALQDRPGTQLHRLLSIFDFFSYAIGALQLAAHAVYLNEYLRLKQRNAKPLIALSLGLSAGIILLAVASQFFPIITWLDADNHYNIASYWISLVLPVIGLIAIMATAIKNRRVLSKKELSILLVYPIVVLISYGLEASIPGLWVSAFGASVALLLVYVNLQVLLDEQLSRQLADSRSAVMLSQIQPHFLYNALTAIAKLCYGNEKAETALITFSAYLRANMDSINQKQPIPFRKELEHVQQYVYLEKLRFERRLQVVYNIQAEDFMLPALTLQPIVENAIRHGVTKRREGGTVVIATEDAGNAYQITVTDDGIGFQPQAQPNEKRSHTGIANVRSRLHLMCGGTLAITSKVGEGTTATLIIPKGGART